MSKFNKLKKLQKQDETEIISDMEVINHAKKDVEKIKALVKFEHTKLNQKLTLALTDEDLQVAKAIALGLTDEEILKEFDNYDHIQLDRLKLNPSFIQEVSQNSSMNGFGNETIRIAKMSRLANTLYESLLANPQQIEEMSARDKFKAINEINANLDKKEQQNGGGKIDLTVILKNRSIEETRLKKDKNGLTYIDSEFPILNEEGEIING